MRKSTFLTAALFFAVCSSNAQTVGTFEALPLATTDTYYVNFSASGTDVGFNSGLVHFPTVYDTAWGGFLSRGFVYSNMTDSTTSGYTNGYSAKAGSGYSGSAKYAVSFGNTNVVHLTGAARNRPVEGFYVTNNTYAYNSMRDGDGFAKKFGGVTGNDPDWFKLTVKGYSGGTLKSSTVDFYLADYRSSVSSADYIVRTWQWVDLLSLGNVDSLHFELSSTDTAGGFGMNTPAYFCIDNFTTRESTVGVGNNSLVSAKVYPNPTKDFLYIDVAEGQVDEVVVSNAIGATVISRKVDGNSVTIPTAKLVPGVYQLTLMGLGSVGSMQFVKE